MSTAAAELGDAAAVAQDLTAHVLPVAGERAQHVRVPGPLGCVADRGQCALS